MSFLGFGEYGCGYCLDFSSLNRGMVYLLESCDCSKVALASVTSDIVRITLHLTNHRILETAHFIGEKTETGEFQVLCPRSHS